MSKSDKIRLALRYDTAAVDLEVLYHPAFEYDSLYTFDTAKLDDFVTTGEIRNDQFTSTLDGAPVIKAYQNVHIKTGHTLTTSQRCKGLYLYIRGDLTIDGILSMSARGCNAAGQFIGIHKLTKRIYFASADLYPKDENWSVIGAIGGAASTVANTAGNKGINGASGGGGCGGVELNYGGRGGFGGRGTSFSGGPGGGGTPRGVAGNGDPNGGVGGTGVSTNLNGTWYLASGGAGNPGGKSTYKGVAGASGTGGLIIMFVLGKIIFGSNGKITSEGSLGGASRNCGGSSGGGAIHIFHAQDTVPMGKISVAGGARVTHTIPGSAGGDGSIRLIKIP